METPPPENEAVASPPQPGLPEWAVWLAARKYLLYPFLAFLALLLYAPGQIELPPLDRDEPRFAQASKQMVESGDYVSIAFQDQPRLKKPIGIYWLQSTSANLLASEPNEIWPYRLPSLVGAIAAVVLCAAIGAVLFPGAVGAVGGMLLAPVLLMSVEAHLAKTDAVLLACILVAQWALARAWMAGTRPFGVCWRVYLAFWLAIGAGILVKGPVILMITGSTAVALMLCQRRARWFLALKPVRGLAIALAVAIPWFVAIHIATDGAFWDEALGKDFLSKIGKGQEAHGAPPGLYLVLVFATFWPASAVLGLAGLAAWRARSEPAVQFCIAWIVPNWIVFEIVATKLPHYVLPLYPAIALLAGYALAMSVQPGNGRRSRIVAIAPVWAAVAVASGLALFMAAAPPFLGGTIDGSGIAAAAAFFAIAYMFYRYARNRLLSPFPLGVVLIAAALAYWPAYRNVVPSFDTLWVSNKLADAFAHQTDDTCPGEPVLFTVGYNEPSLIFLAGTNTRYGNPANAATFIAEDAGCHVAAIDQRWWDEFLAAAPTDRWETVSEVTGLNYSKGRKMHMRLVRYIPE